MEDRQNMYRLIPSLNKLKWKHFAEVNVASPNEYLMVRSWRFINSAAGWRWSVLIKFMAEVRVLCLSAAV
jgi:hypothetical protein